MLKILRSLSKAESLDFLKKNEKKLNIKVPYFFYFTKKEFLKNSDKILKKIEKNFKKKIIIRSSSLSEDNLNQSNAGKFKSFSNLNVKKNNIFILINKILEDFKNKNDQVLIQEFIEKPELSGVIFTRNINNNSPYYTINFDRSGKTDLITSGSFNPLMQTIVIKREKKKKYNFFHRELMSISKIEKLYNNDRLDLEFCKKNNKLYIFQCRPLKKVSNSSDAYFDQSIINIKKKIKKLKKKIPNLFGKTTYFSNMSDWNPAEMIGARPTPLSSSLYSELITDSVWAEQRKNYGYQDVSPNPLMVSFAGAPYIDLRVDFNSFLPSNLPDKIKNKAIDYYLKKIKTKPSLHDKIEFELIETCYDLDSKNKLLNFLNISETSDYLNALRNLTNKIILDNFLDKEIEKVKNLEKKIKVLKKSRLSYVQKIFFLIDDCKKYGTLPFAGAARLAFIATKILRSLVQKGFLSKKNLEEFYYSIPTVTKTMQSFYKNINSKVSKKNFIKIYGHLRPSTYSITSKNYKENFKEYFSSTSIINSNKIKKFQLSKDKEKKINLVFKKNGLKFSTKQFFNFATKSISAREYFKFIFSKSINEIFLNLISLSKEIDISRSDLEFISIKNFLTYHNNVESNKLKKLLTDEIKKNKKNYKFLNLIEYPDIFFSDKDFDFYKLNLSKGNFITDKTVSGKILLLNKVKDYNMLNDKIILIDNADPGYDFIFSYKIKGLITRYGGANSHMSIRCLELGMPAIIGIGSKNYDFISSKNFLQINSNQKFYKIIN